MPRDFTLASRRRKPPVPPESEWSTFSPAVFGTHWTRIKNPSNLRSHGKGYVCLLMTTDFCQHYVKRKAFLDHMRGVHRLNPGPCPIGRPKTSSRVRSSRKEPTEEALRRASASSQGSFSARIWKQKRERMSWLLRWATTLVTVIPKVDPMQWIVKKACERYTDWRHSFEFQETLRSVRHNTVTFWRRQYPDMKLEDIYEKAGVDEDLDGWISDDGMPIVRLNHSDCASGKWVFHPREIQQKLLHVETEDTEKDIEENNHKYEVEEKHDDGYAHETDVDVASEDVQQPVHGVESQIVPVHIAASLLKEPKLAGIRRSARISGLVSICQPTFPAPTGDREYHKRAETPTQSLKQLNKSSKEAAQGVGISTEIVGKDSTVEQTSSLFQRVTRSQKQTLKVPDESHTKMSRPVNETTSGVTESHCIRSAMDENSNIIVFKRKTFRKGAPKKRHVSELGIGRQDSCMAKGLQSSIEVPVLASETQLGKGLQKPVTATDSPGSQFREETGEAHVYHGVQSPPANVDTILNDPHQPSPDELPDSARRAARLRHIDANNFFDWIMTGVARKDPHTFYNTPATHPESDHTFGCGETSTGKNPEIPSMYTPYHFLTPLPIAEKSPASTLPLGDRSARKAARAAMRIERAVMKARKSHNRYSKHLEKAAALHKSATVHGPNADSDSAPFGTEGFAIVIASEACASAPTLAPEVVLQKQQSSIDSRCYSPHMSGNSTPNAIARVLTRLRDPVEHQVCNHSSLVNYVGEHPHHADTPTATAIPQAAAATLDTEGCVESQKYPHSAKTATTTTYHDQRQKTACLGGPIKGVAMQSAIRAGNASRSGSHDAHTPLPISSPSSICMLPSKPSRHVRCSSSMKSKRQTPQCIAKIISNFRDPNLRLSRTGQKKEKMLGKCIALHKRVGDSKLPSQECTLWVDAYGHSGYSVFEQPSRIIHESEEYAVHFEDHANIASAAQCFKANLPDPVGDVSACQDIPNVPFISTTTELQALSRKQWLADLSEAIGNYVSRLEPVAPARKPMVIDGVAHLHMFHNGVLLPFIPSYNTYTSANSKTPLLPLHKTRIGMYYTLEIYYWIYHCRKSQVPFRHPNPHLKWPSSLYVWLGPDGLPIQPRHHGLLIKHRSLLRDIMLRQTLNHGTSDLGYLGRTDIFSPLITDPEPDAWPITY